MTMAHSIPQHGCHSKKDYNFLHAWKLPKVGWFEKIVQFFILVQLHFGWHGIRVPILGNLWGRNMRLIIRIYSSLLFHLGPLNHTFFPYHTDFFDLLFRLMALRWHQYSNLRLFMVKHWIDTVKSMSNFFFEKQIILF